MSKKIPLVAMLAALCISLRLVFGALPNIKPITAIFLVLAESLGLSASLAVMMLTMLVTGFFMGFGPWIIWQILAYTMVLYLWTWLSFLPLKVKIVAAGLSALLYGLAISALSAPLFHMPILAYWFNGLYFDALHGVSTVLFYPLIHQIFRRFFPHEKITD